MTAAGLIALSNVVRAPARTASYAVRSTVVALGIFWRERSLSLLPKALRAAETLLAVLLISIGPTQKANAESRENYLYMVECTSSFIKFVTLLRAKRSVGELVGGEPVSLGFIDHYEQKTEKLISYLLNDSDFSDEARSDIDLEMSGWVAVFQGNNPEAARRSELIALTTMSRCRDELQAKGWFKQN